MPKASTHITNDFCPQTLFLYGTYKADGAPDFGLFCWFSYCWDGQMGVMACIGGEKLTKERIHANGVFSANLVTEAMLPLADYLGNTDGHSPDKMNIPLALEKGHALDVPVLCDSPVVFELEVRQFIPLDDGEVMLCAVRNVLMDEALLNKDLTVAERIAAIRPAHTTCQTYFGWDGKPLGKWGGMRFAGS